MKRNTALAAALAAGLMGIGAAAQAQLIVSVAPPAPRYEVVPAPRAGYVWDAGHYAWVNGTYMWMPGRWVEARSGYDWAPRRWVYNNGGWALVGGNWHPRGVYGDRDRDGIPNYADNRNNNRPYAYRDGDRDGVPNQYDRDRDNDGVPNRVDPRPNNWYR